MNTIVIIVLSVLIVFNIAILCSVFKRIRTIRSGLSVIFDELKSSDAFEQKREMIYNNMLEQFRTLTEQYIAIKSSYDEMFDGYKVMTSGLKDIIDMDEKLDDHYNELEDKYSACYEQYDKIRTELEELERLINERTHDIMATFPMYCPQCNVPDEEFQNERFGVQKEQINFEELNGPILVGDILDEDWNILREEYRQEILEAGYIDADRLGEMIVDSRKDLVKNTDPIMT